MTSDDLAALVAEAQRRLKRQEYERDPFKFAKDLLPHHFSLPFAKLHYDMRDLVLGGKPPEERKGDS